MTKLAAAVLILVSFLFALPVIESTGSTQVFQSVGTADSGAGGDG